MAGVTLLMGSRSYTGKIIRDSVCRSYGKGITLEKGISSDVEFHSRLADQWWDTQKNLLHKYNEVRVPFITNGLGNAGLIYGSDLDPGILLKGLKILDVGCGGGVLSEALARLRGEVIGIDPSAELINVAKSHAAKDIYFEKYLRYEKTELPVFAEKYREEFDVVVASEVIEHVFDKEKFVWNCLRCIKPRGCLFITTPNKTFWSKVMIIKFAELFNLVPCGTHDFSKFITPEELSDLMKKLGCQILKKEGFLYLHWSQKFTESRFDNLLYGMQARKL